MGAFDKLFFSVAEELAKTAKQPMPLAQWQKFYQPGRMLERGGMRFPLKSDELKYGALSRILEGQIPGTAGGNITPQEMSSLIRELGAGTPDYAFPPANPQFKTLGEGPRHQFGTAEEQAAAHERYRRALQEVQNYQGATMPGNPEWEAAREELRTADAAMRDIVPGWGRAEGSPTFPMHYKDQYQLPGEKLGQAEELTLIPGVDFVPSAGHFNRQPGLLSWSRTTRRPVSGADVQPEPLQLFEETSGYGDQIVLTSNWNKANPGTGLDGYIMLDERPPQPETPYRASIQNQREYFATPEEAKAWVRSIQIPKLQQNVQSGTYWDRKQVKSGPTAYHIEEIQSDWHQQGRQGYRPNYTESDIKKFTAKNEQREQIVVRDAQGNEVTTLPGGTAITGGQFGHNEQSALETAAEWVRSGKGYLDRPPHAPYKDTYADLELRKGIAKAIEQGDDYVTWTTGDQQIDRWSLGLRNVVDEIKWWKNADGTYTIAPMRGGRDMGADPKYEKMSAERLEDMVGSEIAKKITGGEGRLARQITNEEKTDLKLYEEREAKGQLNAAGKRRLEKLRNKIDYASAGINTEDAGTISGDNLTVGGEGMRLFYDRKVKSAAEKLAKQYGGEVTQIDLPGGVNKEQEREIRRAWNTIDIASPADLDNDQLMDNMLIASGFDDLYSSPIELEAMELYGAAEEYRELLDAHVKRTGLYAQGQIDKEELDLAGDRLEKAEKYWNKAKKTFLRAADKHRAERTQPQKVHALRITPEMKEKIMKAGLPLFSIGALAGVGAGMYSDNTQAQEFADGGPVLPKFDEQREFEQRLERWLEEQQPVLEAERREREEFERHLRDTADVTHWGGPNIDPDTGEAIIDPWLIENYPELFDPNYDRERARLGLDPYAKFDPVGIGPYDQDVTDWLRRNLPEQAALSANRVLGALPFFFGSSVPADPDAPVLEKVTGGATDLLTGMTMTGGIAKAMQKPVYELAAGLAERAPGAIAATLPWAALAPMLTGDVPAEASDRTLESLVMGYGKGGIVRKLINGIDDLAGAAWLNKETGEIYGPYVIHADVFDDPDIPADVMERLGLPRETMGGMVMDDGFITHEGEYISRKDASRATRSQTGLPELHGADVEANEYEKWLEENPDEEEEWYSPEKRAAGGPVSILEKLPPAARPYHEALYTLPEDLPSTAPETGSPSAASAPAMPMAGLVDSLTTKSRSATAEGSTIPPPDPSHLPIPPNPFRKAGEGWTDRLFDQLWRLPVDKLPPSARSFILGEEGLNQPAAWPKGNSGITLGRGYDLGQHTMEEFQKDWAPHLTPAQMKRLEKAIGKSGLDAQALAPMFKDIRITPAMADAVFDKRSGPKYIKQAYAAFPGMENLPEDAQIALVSLVYNRGPTLQGERRTEMKAIHDILKDGVQAGDLQKIADQIRSMKRLWQGKGLAGLEKRRDREADLVLSALKTQEASSS